MRRLAWTLIFPLLAGCASRELGHSKELASVESSETLCSALQGFLEKDLENYQNEVDQVSRDYQVEQWMVETADPNASQDKLSKLFEVLQSTSYNTEILNKTRSLDSAAKTLNPKDCPAKIKFVRAKQLIETSILTDSKVIQKEKENQDKQDSMMNQSNAFRIEIAGEKEPISKALYGKKLRSLEDRKARQELYQKYNSARAKKWVEWGFKDLVKARNEEGRLAGFKNYYEYRFFRGQLDYKNYRTQVQEIKAKLAPKVRRVLARLGKQFKIDKVQAWDMGYIREKSSAGEVNEFLKPVAENAVLDMARKFYSSLGIDIDSYHFLMDLYPRPGKNTHAFAMGVVAPHVDAQGKLLSEPKTDIRFLANLKQPVKWEDTSTVIHELGHAIHFGEIRQPTGIFRGFGSVETEAIAMTLERMADSGEFLEAVLPQFTGVSKEKLAPVLKKQVKAAQLEQAFVLMRQVFFSDFEHEIYQNPEQDYAALWSKMHKEYWGVEVPVEYADWDVEHFLMAPIYVQNYAIGILMVEQFYESILKEFKTSYSSTKIGDKLRSLYFGPGLEFDYLALTRQFTGKNLTAEAALRLIKE
jgi:oligoendopeptidase F